MTMVTLLVSLVNSHANTLQSTLNKPHQLLTEQHASIWTSQQSRKQQSSQTDFVHDNPMTISTTSDASNAKDDDSPQFLSFSLISDAHKPTIPNNFLQ